MGKLSGNAFSRAFKKKHPDIEEQQNRIMDSPEFRAFTQKIETEMAPIIQQAEPMIEKAVSNLENSPEVKALDKKIEQETGNNG